jgi:ABC-type amino acid transport substrate-binding protein
MKESHKYNAFLISSLLLLTLSLVTACTTVTHTVSPDGVTGSTDSPLRVGISTNAPPLAFKEGGKIQGLEVDFALQLGRFLNRNIQFKELKWDDQIPALEADKIDVIMSGMTITKERSYRVTFSKPYLRSGQMLLVKSQKAGLYSSGIYSLMGTRPAIGTIHGTTGDLVITGTINRANITRYHTTAKAVRALEKDEIDVFVHDAPIVCYFAFRSKNNDLTPIRQMASEEYLAWAVNRSNSALLEQLNAFLVTQKNSGNLQQSIKHWIPFMLQ